MPEDTRLWLRAPPAHRVGASERQPLLEEIEGLVVAVHIAPLHKVLLEMDEADFAKGRPFPVIVILVVVVVEQLLVVVDSGLVAVSFLALCFFTRSVCEDCKPTYVVQVSPEVVLGQKS